MQKTEKTELGFMWVILDYFVDRISFYTGIITELKRLVSPLEQH